MTVDCRRVYVQTRAVGRTDYINAVFIPVSSHRGVSALLRRVQLSQGIGASLRLIQKYRHARRKPQKLTVPDCRRFCRNSQNAEQSCKILFLGGYFLFTCAVLAAKNRSIFDEVLTQFTGVRFRATLWMLL